MNRTIFDKIEIFGGKELFGSVEVTRAKNAILPIIAATILCDGEVVLKDIPSLSDIEKMMDIIVALGGHATRNKNDITICTNDVCKFEIPPYLASEIRSSIFMLGPILARHKKARVAFPGGCDIGSRPIDLHLAGLRDLGVLILEEHGFIECDGKKMKNGIVHLDFPSVGATENIMMASVFLKGETTILNAAKEPEIVDLANFINKMGGKIFGAGTSTIKIRGVSKLHGTCFTPMPDRIVAGTYLISCAMTGGKILLKRANFEHVYSLISKLRNSGCQIDYKDDKIILEAKHKPLSCSSIETQPYPGFPTDLQAQFLALQTVSEGISVITENLFETRFKHVPELLKMGAKITTRDRMAIVRGGKLFGANVDSHDLRGGAALVLAGLAAKGRTTVSNVHFIDRGYEQIEKSFSLLGADIKRV